MILSLNILFESNWIVGKCFHTSAKFFTNTMDAKEGDKFFWRYPYLDTCEILLNHPSISVWKICSKHIKCGPNRPMAAFLSPKPVVKYLIYWSKSRTGQNEFFLGLRLISCKMWHKIQWLLVVMLSFSPLSFAILWTLRAAAC